jgi:hypothetical protein
MPLGPPATTAKVQTPFLNNSIDMQGVAIAKHSNTAIIRGFAGKTLLPDQLFSGEFRTMLKPWPDLPVFGICIFWII